MQRRKGRIRVSRWQGMGTAAISARWPGKSPPAAADGAELPPARRAHGGAHCQSGWVLFPSSSRLSCCSHSRKETVRAEKENACHQHVQGEIGKFWREQRRHAHDQSRQTPSHGGACERTHSTENRDDEGLGKYATAHFGI